MGVLPVGRAPEGGDIPQVSLFWSLPTAEMDAFFAGDFAAWQARVRQVWPAAAPAATARSRFGRETW